MRCKMNCFWNSYLWQRILKLEDNMILHLSKITETFAERLPISNYEDHHANIERSRNGENNIFWPTPIKWFAKSSGTTNAKSKFIPVSMNLLKTAIMLLARICYACILTTMKIPNCLLEKVFVLVAVKSLYTENGTVFGDLSAILIDNMPFWAEFSSTPSSQVSLMSDWEYKMQAIVNETINENVTSLAGVHHGCWCCSIMFWKPQEKTICLIFGQI